MRRQKVQTQTPAFLGCLEFVTWRTARLKLLLLPSDKLPEPYDMVELPGIAFLPTERTQVSVSLQQLRLLLARKVFSCLASLDQQQQDLGTDSWQPLASVLDTQV